VKRVLERSEVEYMKRVMKKTATQNISPDNFIYLKKLFDIYTVCLVEISDELIFMDLSPMGGTLLRLFHSFKVNILNLLKYGMSSIAKVLQEIEQVMEEEKNPEKKSKGVCREESRNREQGENEERSK